MEHSPASFTALAQQYRQRLALCKQLESKRFFLHQRMVQFREGGDPRIRAVVPLLNAQIRQLGERMWQENARTTAVAQRLNSQISQLNNERMELILHCRYLEMMTWDEISEITGVGLRWLHRLHKKALDILSDTDCQTK